MFNPIASRWMRSCSGELFDSVRTTITVDDAGEYWLFKVWPMAAARVPEYEPISDSLAAVHLSSLEPVKTASGFGCIEDRGWKTASKIEYRENAALKRHRDTRKDHQEYRDMGVGLVPESFRYADHLINPKGAGHE